MNKISRNRNRESLPIPSTTIQAEVPKTIDQGLENTVLDENKCITKNVVLNEASSTLKKIEDQGLEARSPVKEFNTRSTRISECLAARFQMVKFDSQFPRLYIEENQKIILNSRAVSKFSLKEGGYAVLFYSHDDLYSYIGIKSSIREMDDPAAHRLRPGYWLGSLCITCPEFFYFLQLKGPLAVKVLPLKWDPEQQMIWGHIRGINP